MGVKPTPGSVKSSRTSLIVKDACSGPRRPTTRTVFTRLLESVSRACSAMSVFRNLSTLLSNVRATSRATFPCPITMASSPESRSGAKFLY